VSRSRRPRKQRAPLCDCWRCLAGAHKRRVLLIRDDAALFDELMANEQKAPEHSRKPSARHATAVSDLPSVTPVVT
jgi:hypothetical protein